MFQEFANVGTDVDVERVVRNDIVVGILHTRRSVHERVVQIEQDDTPAFRHLTSFLLVRTVTRGGMVVVDDFHERIQAHERLCPRELKEQIGRVVERFAEQDLSRSHYLNMLVNVQRHISEWAKRVLITPPLWVESSGSFSCLLSHLNPIRRDLRHRIVSDLMATDVIRRHDGRTVDDVQYNYNPFRFACSSERERESLMRDLHHELTALLPLFDSYIPNTRALERQILRNLRESKQFSGWDVHRITIGHVERDTDYALDPRLSHDYIIFSQQSADDMRTVRLRQRITETSTPQHTLLTRETYENSNRDRLYANVVLYVNAYLQRRSGRRERVVSSFDFTIFVLVVELPNSPRHTILSQTGITRVIAPLTLKIRTLTPDQWFRYVLAFIPNPILSAVWYVLREVFYTDTPSFVERLRRLDARIPDRLTPEEVLGMLPPRQQEHVQRIVSTGRVRLSHMVRVRCKVPPSQCLAGRIERGDLVLASRYMTHGRWTVVTARGEQWAPGPVATFYVANLVARRTLDCIIASHMLTDLGDYHVSYVSSDSLHDTFF